MEKKAHRHVLTSPFSNHHERLLSSIDKSRTMKEFSENSLSWEKFHQKVERIRLDFLFTRWPIKMSIDEKISNQMFITQGEGEGEERSWRLLFVRNQNDHHDEKERKTERRFLIIDAISSRGLRKKFLPKTKCFPFGFLSLLGQRVGRPGQGERKRPLAIHLVQRNDELDKLLPFFSARF